MEGHPGEGNTRGIAGRAAKVACEKMPTCRADVIGSMLRPAYLLKAREEHAAGRLADADFKRLEDRAVDECVAVQERSGVDVVTDGEQRRNVFASQLVQSA